MRVPLEKAVDLLRGGEVVAIPTETVYGLAAWLFKESAIEKIFTLKNRPSTNPLIIHVRDADECAFYASAQPADVYKLTEAFWPGPLTVVLPIHEKKVPLIARAGLKTAAFRCPAHPVAAELLKCVSPLVAPSANLSGTPSSTKPEHVEHDFGPQFPALEGECRHGLESTIIAQKNGLWEIARLGAISPEEIARIIGYLPKCAHLVEKTPICPGQLLVHYAPKARLILSNTPYEACEKKCPVVLGFTDRVYPGAKKWLFLGSLTAPHEVSFNLYDCLRRLDIEGIKEAWVDLDIPHNGIWATIRERLFRAAGATLTLQ
ncbi:MAG: threonylcarbamoyl-AMP synthase [Verrucomicrobia bacterium]|nr:threonylcarbamoyl-AMP synthase [Verrucomicrobiota bacterium]